ncbi:MAG TPA: hypothetical protein VFC19_23815 [Candidatus Limnocylindrales bacterium]|nr:hypothetical protein [Candidatus Limnocylindrales bacterium]
MGAYNTFVVTLPAPDGSGPIQCRLQARVGLLQYTDIRVGEPVLPAPIETLKGVIGPSEEALRGVRPFWAYGIGTCGDDETNPLCGRLHFRDGVFVGAEFVDCPDNLLDWGFEA